MNEAPPTSDAATGPRTAAANTVGRREIDDSTVELSLTRARSATAAIAARPTTGHIGGTPVAAKAAASAVTAAAARAT
jgi:hypothetical protein